MAREKFVSLERKIFQFPHLSVFEERRINVWKQANQNYGSLVEVRRFCDTSP